MIAGNKGEWSEIYALFKLLGDKRLFIGDADLNKVEEAFYPIIKIIRNENGDTFNYELSGDLVIISGGIETLRISINTFAEQATKLLATIKGSAGTFSIPEVEAFMTSVNCKSLKAKSTSKTDIRIVIHDPVINQRAELGFSIKSQIGNDATLFNAARTTNFIYKINNCDLTVEDIESINGIDTRSKIKDRITAIRNLGGELNFVALENLVFQNNLVLIDSWLPAILAEILKSFFTTNLSTIQHLSDNISIINPLNYDIRHAHAFYKYKIKRFLADVALGMTSSKVWEGIYDATGGYLIVKESGEILCYHIYNRNQFEDYLFKNTKLETPSSTKHGFGKIHEENGALFFKLNLQIRFK